jgi:hypothetical protein
VHSHCRPSCSRNPPFPVVRRKHIAHHTGCTDFHSRRTCPSITSTAKCARNFAAVCAACLLHSLLLTVLPCPRSVDANHLNLSAPVSPQCTAPVTHFTATVRADAIMLTADGLFQRLGKGALWGVLKPARDTMYALATRCSAKAVTLLHMGTFEVCCSAALASLVHPGHCFRLCALR